MAKRIQLVNTGNPLPRGNDACQFCLFNHEPLLCSEPEYGDCVYDKNSYYAEVDDDSPTN